MTTETFEARKEDLVERLAVRAAERFSGEGAAAAAEFVRRYYALVAPQDILTENEGELVGAALALWELASRRAEGECRLRVYNPDPSVDGYDSDHSVVEVVHEDMPFLVDSVIGELNRRGRTVHLVVHPVVTVRRDDAGRRIGGLDAAGEDALRESLIQVEMDQETSPEALETLRKALERVLADVRTVVGDFAAMREELKRLRRELEDASPRVAEASDLEESRAFLQWLDDNHFTYLGLRRFELARDEEGGEGETVRVLPGTGLGMLRDTTAESFPLSPETAVPTGRNPLLIVSKAGRRSTVHRPVHMDYVGLRYRDAEGRVTGGVSLIGLFTASVYNTSAATVPVLRNKIERVMKRAGFQPMGHDAKALLHILETFPRDELFQMTDDQLFQTSLGVLQLHDRQRLALFVRQDSSERFVSCLIFVPRDRYDTDLRRRIQRILEAAFQGSLSAFYTQVADSPLARVHLVIRTAPGRIPEYDVQELEARLTEASLSWADRLQHALVESHGEEEGLALFKRYGDSFPTGYREHFEPDTAVADVDELETLLAGEDLRLDLYRPAGASHHELRFKIFHTGLPRPLTDVLPMLENMGLKVIAEVPYEITPEAVPEELWIRDLRLRTSFEKRVDLDEVRESFQETFGRVWRGAEESDAFNRLVLAMGLAGRQVVALRAYARYLRQVGVTFSQTYMAETLARNAEVTRLLVELFETRFDPEPPEPEGERGGGRHLTRADPASRTDRQRREARCAEIVTRIRKALNEVGTLDEDRILRRFRNLIEATLRTNYFQQRPDGSPRPYLSFKLDSQRITGLPRPRPMVEIFVYSPRTEAVHLRGGRVARGGIRWSDRREDFRDEILGLMKSQMVKNAVIVPVGAKGGFILKRPGSGHPEDRQREAVECYKTMIRGLLDLTDNLEGETVVPPSRVVRWDDDDPYLVVAADKGTATFSDLANEVAAEYRFWLGDAFASGGSAGYDHKKMGITARGAWESVKRHFREMGRDIRHEPFTVVGVGDMSGDVFGNGMLLSRHTRLVGAFNHLHVFLDPDPDPETGFAERERLFRTPRSTWADYDPDKISAGGGVFERSAKSVPLSPQVRELLGVDKKSLAPSELIKALLRAPVDLLFLGGIGTYVKAGDETHAATGDRQNDEVRVDARKLRCRVVGEGANLGLTQRGRIELALHGGRVNTDFIDNSGGVDCSDHEVNIKILLGEPLSQGRIGLEERNGLLGRMTDEVAALVLRDNYLQSQAISVAEAQGAAALDQQVALIRELERERNLDRELEALPDDETLDRRRSEGRGLTRPEIAVLLAYAKIRLFDQLLASDLPEDPQLVQDLLLYFPRPLRESFQPDIERHRLRREIIATYITNSVINRVGPTFLTRMAAETARGATDIARAYTLTRDIFRLRETWAEIEALDGRVPAEVQTAMILEVGRVVERGTLWFLRRGRHPLHIADEVERFLPPVTRLADSLEDLLLARDREKLRSRTERHVRRGVPEDLAREVARLEFLGSTLDIVEIAQGHDSDVAEVARIYFRVGARFQLEWMRVAAQALSTESHWTKSAVEALTEDLFGHQSALTRSVLAAAEKGGGEGALRRWLAEHRGAVARLDHLFADLKAAPSPDLAMFTVVNHHLRLLRKDA